MSDATDSLWRKTDTAAAAPAPAWVALGVVAPELVDARPGERQDAGGEQDLQRVAPQERLDAQVPGLGRRGAQRVLQPDEAEGIDHDVAQHHRGQRPPGLAVPAPVRHPAD